MNRGRWRKKERREREREGEGERKRETKVDKESWRDLINGWKDRREREKK